MNSRLSPPFNWNTTTSPHSLGYGAHETQVLAPNPTAAMHAATGDNEAEPSTNKRSRRRDLNWEEHKLSLKSMWLTENKRLEDIMGTMQKDGFTATAKQYKEQFKLWGWRRNLPHEKAVWMVEKANKRKREERKDTEFVFGGLMWTKERAEASAKRAKRTEIHSGAMDVDTPAGISYTTPKTVIPMSPEAQYRGRGGQDASSDAVSVSSSPPESACEGNENRALSTAWNGFTKANLDGILEMARASHRVGEIHTAEQQYQQVWAGYKTVLGPTHDESTKVAYTLAALYSEQDQIVSANKILDESSKAYIDELGIENKRSWQHVLHVVELLSSWNRPSDALAFLSRAKDLVATTAPLSSTARRRGRKGGKSLTVAPTTAPNLRLLDAAQSMVTDLSPEGINSGLETARAYVQDTDQAVEPLLIAIIKHCGYDTDRLAIQRVKAWAELLKLYIKLGAVWDNVPRFHDASAALMEVLSNYPWDERKFKCLEVMESLLELAAAFLRADRDDAAFNQFRQTIDKAEILFGIDDERTIWMLISVGKVYQSSRGWNLARAWFEQALAGAMTAFGENDGITLSLEAAMENCHFSYLNDETRPFKSIFGVTGITIKPGRLHLE